VLGGWGGHPAWPITEYFVTPRANSMRDVILSHAFLNSSGSTAQRPGWSSVAIYSITSSARASSVCGTLRPSALAVFRLMTKDAEAQRMMLKLANDYDKLADRAEDRATCDRTGSLFRPLYDNKIWFNGQPIALVVAETSEVARFAASLVRVEYDREAHVTDVYRSVMRPRR
jgi:Aldehyde oxidase and xanthine dehydrogenase, a/b hammerhead domain